jgi:hypothetical protein
MMGHRFGPLRIQREFRVASDISHDGCPMVFLRRCTDLDRLRVVPLSVGHMNALLQTKADEWRALHRKHAPIARQMVRKLVEGRIVFTPDGEARRYTFLATGMLANFFSGLVCPQAVASPTGRTDTYEAGRAETYELPLCGTVRRAV